MFTCASCGRDRENVHLGVQLGDVFLCADCKAAGRRVASPAVPTAPAPVMDMRIEQEVLDAAREGLAKRLGVRSERDAWAIVWVRKRAERAGALCLILFFAFLYWGFLTPQWRAELDVEELMFAGLGPCLATLAILFMALPGKRLVARRMDGVLLAQHTCLGIAYRTRRIERQDILALSVMSTGVSMSEPPAPVPTSGGGLMIAAVAMAGGSAPESRPRSQGVHAIQVALRDGTSVRFLYTRSEEDCQGAVKALRQVLEVATRR